MVEEFGTVPKRILRPRARILRAIGDQLISSETVALLELVKNAHDADARFVVIRISGDLRAGEGAVEVADDGHGMDMAVWQLQHRLPGDLFASFAAAVA